MELLGKSAQELRALLASLGQPAYRGAQLYHALYRERQLEVRQMTALPAWLRTRLEQETSLRLPRLVERYQSADGSIRYLLALETEGAKPASIETVFMPEAGRQTICISTQVGCAVDCRFCLTAQLGLIRNLTAGEIVGQVLVALRENRAGLAPRTNVVLMGQGEPLLNYEPVRQAIRILLDPYGMALSPKHVTVSTSGIVPGIKRMARESVRAKLAVSLNASTDEQRSQIMPINRKYPLGMLLDACRQYPLRPWEQLTFEYVLLDGFNDQPEDARRLVKLLANLRAKLNLIPWNPDELPYRAPERSRVEAFRALLVDRGVPAWIRYSRGQDVMAACGQLALIDLRQPGPQPSAPPTAPG